MYDMRLYYYVVLFIPCDVLRCHGDRGKNTSRNLGRVL